MTACYTQSPEEVHYQRILIEHRVRMERYSLAKALLRMDLQEGK